ncbi:hypothetical protein, partial [Peribacillus frigoritolerans]|uniref:hypothetical protein n=1 Tax=Peribacillus frigoritolerans TaxID=450367 RepID=UPI001E57188D
MKINYRSWSFWFTLVAILCAPILLNVTLFQFTTGLTYKGDWLSFWGNYSGGLISAVVAYVVANSQIQKQLTLDLAKEKYSKMVSQLPSLVRIQIELNTYIEEISSVKADKDYFLFTNSNLSTGEYVIEYGEIDLKVIGRKYEIVEFNSDNYKLLESVENDELHIELINCFRFYNEFSKAISFDITLIVKKLNEIIEVQTQNTSIDTNLTNSANRLHLDMEKYFKKKENAWNKLQENDMLNKFEQVLSDVSEEIE